MFRCKHTARLTESKSGFTLIELLLVIVLLSVFIGAVYQATIIGLRSANHSDERETLRQQMANALDVMIREAALAGNVDNAEDDRFQFDADIDGDGSPENNINYRLQNGNLERSLSSTAVVLVNNVSSVDFSYRDNSDSNLATPVVSQPARNTIRVMQITITAVNDDESISLASAAFLRNNQ